MARIPVFAAVLMMIIAVTNVSAAGSAIIADKGFIVRSLGINSSEIAPISEVYDLLGDDATTNYAVLLGKRLLFRYKSEHHDNEYCLMAVLLGEHYRYKSTQKGMEQSLRMKYINTSSKFFDEAIENWNPKTCNANTMLLAFSKRIEMTITAQGPDKAADWSLDQIYKQEYSPIRLDIVNAALDVLKQKLHDPTTLILPQYFVLVTLRENLTKKDPLKDAKSIDRELASLRSKPGFKQKFQEMTNITAVPHQNTFLEFLVIILAWLLSLPLIMINKKHLKKLRRRFSAWLSLPLNMIMAKLIKKLRKRKAGNISMDATYSLWQDDNWSSAKPREDDNHIILKNDNNEYAPFNNFCFYKNDPIAKYFIMLNTATYRMILATFIIGFTALVALNYLEGTLYQSEQIKLTFWRSVADPINWGILVPLFIYSTRALYLYIPYSFNYLFEHVTSREGNCRKKIVEQIKKSSRLYNFEYELTVKLFKFKFTIKFSRLKAIILFSLSLIISLLTYINYAQKVTFYGTDYSYSISHIGHTFNMPTILGWYTIFILTLLIYTIGNVAMTIIYAIGMFNQIYKNKSIPLCINLLHPDSCGGFAFAGTLALKIGLTATVASLMGFDLVLRDIYIAKTTTPSLYYYFLLVAYLTILPTAYFAPILHARSHLKFAKDRMLENMNKWSYQAHQALSSIENITLESIAKPLRETEIIMKFLDREHPTWPVRIRSLSAFVTFFLFPLVVALIQSIAQRIK